MRDIKALSVEMLAKMKNGEFVTVESFDCTDYEFEKAIELLKQEYDLGEGICVKKWYVLAAVILFPLAYLFNLLAKAYDVVTSAVMSLALKMAKKIKTALS